MNRILTINRANDSFWYQLRENNYQVGRYSLAPDILLNDARSNGAFIFDITELDSRLMARLRKKFWNQRGCTDDVEMYVEVLRLNKAKEIT